MKGSRSSVPRRSFALCLLLLAGCRRRGIEDFAATLPELPKELEATLDPKTLATKLPTSSPPPERASAAALAPCCASRDTKSLTVRFAYTKCGPLRDFIMAPLGDAVLFDPTRSGAGRSPGLRPVTIHRRGELNRTSVLDTIVCVTSEGPWSATLTEDRFCSGYTPQDTLFISAFGDPVLFVWNGGPANHPAAVKLASCREIGLVRYACGGISDCPCTSEPCPAEQPCDCGLQGQW